MLRPVLLRRVGAVVALLGVSCLLVALVLPWVHFEPNRARNGMEGVVPVDYSALRLLLAAPNRSGSQPGYATLIFYLLPVLGSCLVAVDALRAWQGSAATRSGIARLLLGMGCALFGLAAIPPIVSVAVGIFNHDGPPMLASVGPGASLASLGFVVVVAGGVLLALSSGWQSRMLLAVTLRHVGAVVALLGIGFLLLAPVLTWVHFTPDLAFYHYSDREGVVPGDYSLLRLLVTPNRTGSRLAAAALTLSLLPLLGSCGVVVEALRAGQGRAATRAGSALLLLGMGCALFGLAATPALVQVALGIVTGGSVMPLSWAWAGAGGGVASLGFSAVVAGGVLLAVGALLHRWTLRRNASRASATTG